MFRISQYMQEIAAPTPLGPKRSPPGAVGDLLRSASSPHLYGYVHDYKMGEANAQRVGEYNLYNKINRSEGTSH